LVGGIVSRTAEEIAADEALREAIDRAWIAGFGDGDGGLTEYIVIASRRNFDEHGTSETSVATLISDGEVPIHQLLGLCDYAATRYRKLIAED
jgi:hypothetical protein